MDYSTDAIYTWYRNNVQVQKGTDSSYVAYVSGSYSVEVSYGDCSDNTEVAVTLRFLPDLQWTTNPTATIEGDSVIFTGCLTNVGKAAFFPPIYITYYKNDILAGNILIVDTIKEIIMPDSTLCFRFVLHGVQSYAPVNSIWISVNDSNSVYPHQRQCALNGRFEIKMKVSSLLYGTVFPFIHKENMGSQIVEDFFNSAFPVEVKLYAATATNPTAIRSSTPLHETTAQYYPQTGTRTNSFSPGTFLYLDNQGVRIHWDSLFDMAPTAYTPEPSDLGKWLMDGNLVTTRPIGLFVFEDVPEGDYVLVISRAGYMTRYAEVHVDEAGGSLRHRELVPGDVNDDGVIDDADIQLIISNATSSWVNEKYNSRYDINSDGRVDGLDVSAARAFVGFKAKFYSDTKEWLEKY